MARCYRADAGPADDVPGPCRLPVRQSGEDRQPQHRRRRGSGASEALARRRAARTAGVRPGSRAAGRDRGGQVGRPIRGRGSASAGRARRAICGCRPTAGPSPRSRPRRSRSSTSAWGEQPKGSLPWEKPMIVGIALKTTVQPPCRPVHSAGSCGRGENETSRRRIDGVVLTRSYKDRWPALRELREKIAKPETSSRCPGASAGIVSRRVARELERCRSARGRWA